MLYSNQFRNINQVLRKEIIEMRMFYKLLCACVPVLICILCDLKFSYDSSNILRESISWVITGLIGGIIFELLSTVKGIFRNNVNLRDVVSCYALSFLSTFVGFLHVCIKSAIPLSNSILFSSVFITGMIVGVLLVYWNRWKTFVGKKKES